MRKTSALVALIFETKIGEMSRSDRGVSYGREVLSKTCFARRRGDELGLKLLIVNI